MDFKCLVRYEFVTPDGEECHMECTGTKDGNETKFILPKRNKEIALKWNIKKEGSRINLSDRCTLVSNHKETTLDLKDFKLGKAYDHDHQSHPVDKDFAEVFNKLKGVTQDAQYIRPQLQRCLDRLQNDAQDAGSSR